jgi:hypothetical protein
MLELVGGYVKGHVDPGNLAGITQVLLYRSALGFFSKIENQLTAMIFILTIIRRTAELLTLPLGRIVR